MRQAVFCALLFIGLAPAAAAQEQSPGAKRFGDYEVHYSVFRSTFLKPGIAAQYGITRGKKRAILNVSVRRGRGAKESRPSAVEITGTWRDLIHRHPLSFVEIRERGAIYYLAEFHSNPPPQGEIIYFRFTVRTEDGRRHRVDFQRRLYAE